MNRLTNEKSPYLLQHKNNPVDWYPWGEEAFEKAKREDKPVFLSIGYATCHWCHVMEHESFEDEEVARRMNETFVNIKVDREERPDIDHTYMTVCQMLTGHGGWPLTIVMTPDKEPFYAATYLPKHSRPNRIGMMEFVPAIENAWKNDRQNILTSAERIKEGFSRSLELGKSGGSLPPNIIRQARQSLAERFDASEGGFGQAPKFPSPHNLLFLINRYRKEADPEDLEMVRLTLEKMRLGGLWDHVGFGFHRYSTDRHWLLPHFEKMLYDQATLLLAYAEGWEITGDPLFRETAHEIAEYVDECLTSPEGAFYSAEDADSEGEEGKFYVWETDEIRAILDEKDTGIFLDLYRFEEDGNFLDEATHQKTGKNIPHLKNRVSVEMKSTVDNILSRLKKERGKRVRPLLDDKILTDWNGLMIAALARAGVILDDATLVERAGNAWKIIEHYCLQGDRLLHRMKDGDAAIEGMADDYVFSIWGLIELYNATFEPDYLDKAVRLQNRFDIDFFDEEHGGWYFTSGNAEKLLGRQKEIYDGAVPSSNSVAVHNGISLSRFTANPDYEKRAATVFRAFSEQIAHAPAGYTHTLNAYNIYRDESAEVVITAKTRNKTVEKALRFCREQLPAGSVILLKTEQYDEILSRIAPFVKHYPIHETFAAYVCRNFECKAPVFSLLSLKKELPG
ncbi:MAG: thioredoxin domain-containing protein [Balneolaceae bacterium]|nr:MAG: thioredoxin domain-containing protein [Balneolaceae bacterium]